MDGVTFGAKHSYDDFGLILSSKSIGFPEPKMKTIEVPGADGVIDLTEVLTNDVKYNNRKLSFTFTVIHPMALWAARLSEVSNYVHGRKLHILLDWDRSDYYEGRCKVNQFKSSKRLGTIVIEADCDPYKYEKYSSLEPWVWDVFHFETGVIREYRNLRVSGSLTLNIPGCRKMVAPVFHCSAQLTVEYQGRVYSLPAGKSRVTEISFGEGEHLLTFIGNGIVSVDYRGGSL